MIYINIQVMAENGKLSYFKKYFIFTVIDFTNSVELRFISYLFNKIIVYNKIVINMISLIFNRQTLVSDFDRGLMALVYNYLPCLPLFRKSFLNWLQMDDML